MATSNDWESALAPLRARADAMHAARERVLVETRRMIQAASKSIRHVHRQQYPEALRLLDEAKGHLATARGLLAPDLELNPAYLHDAEKEVVEAAVVYAIVREEPIPSADDLRSGTMSYLNGLGEAASEVRRFALDAMRRGELATAERILEEMEAIYGELITFDYPDSLTNGLRRTCDALRAVVERTRSDLTTTAGQQELVRELRRVSGGGEG